MVFCLRGLVLGAARHLLPIGRGEEHQLLLHQWIDSKINRGGVLSAEELVAAEVQVRALCKQRKPAYVNKGERAQACPSYFSIADVLVMVRSSYCFRCPSLPFFLPGFQQNCTTSCMRALCPICLLLDTLHHIISGPLHFTQ